MTPIIEYRYLSQMINIEQRNLAFEVIADGQKGSCMGEQWNEPKMQQVRPGEFVPAAGLNGSGC